MDEAEFKKLKSEHEEAVRTASEARGVLRSLRERLAKEFGLKDIPAARARLAELDKKTATLKKDFEKSLAQYRKEFSNE